MLTPKYRKKPAKLKATNISLNVCSQLQLKSYINYIYCGMWKHLIILDMMWGGAYEDVPIYRVSHSPLSAGLLDLAPSFLPVPLLPCPPFVLISQFLLFHPGCHCPSGLKQMPQESPTSLDKQLASCPHPHEESQQLALTRPSRVLSCSLRSSQAAKDKPQACPGQARMGGILIESGTGRQCHVASRNTGSGIWQTRIQLPHLLSDLGQITVSF